MYGSHDKRRRGDAWPLDEDAIGFDSPIEYIQESHEDILANTSLYALHDPFTHGLVQARKELNNSATHNDKKRGTTTTQDGHIIA